jgi:hypothetical protein
LINISLPSATEKYYSYIDSFLIGPIGPNKDRDQDIVPMRSSLDTLIEGDSRYHENNVEHTKSEGTITFIPATFDLSKVYRAGYPSNTRFLCKNGSTNTTVDAAWGLLGSTPYVVNPNYNIYYSGSRYSYVVHHIAAYSGIPLRTSGPTTKGISATIYKYVFDFDSLSSNKAYYYRTWISRDVVLSDYIDDFSELTFGILSTMYESGGNERVRMPRTLTGYTAYTARNPIADLSVSGARDFVEARVIPEVTRLTSSLQEVHYGELAMEASQKVNANDTNMIAFFRDLRKPKELIPKLKNLSSIKTHTGNYLGVNYGILPTISDLQEIVAAFRKAKPYLDRNGFKIYTAVRSQENATSSGHASLTQRLKIAIEDEDSFFAELARKVDSAGFALTLENVWDLIPYSFVLDWFIDVGSFLERVDSRMRLLYQNIRYVTMSRKDIRSLSIQTSTAFPFVGSIQLVRYQRWTQDHCPVPPLFFRNTPSYSDHWLEAGALITQRSKLK